MSSRSIGVTNVWLRRWMMSCVIRSPACSQIRISRASSFFSGYWVSSSSSSDAARRMFPPASSNRSKKCRSRGARAFARRTGGKLALRHVEPGQLHAASRELADALAHRGHGCLPVIFDPPALDAVAVHHRVGGAMVPVPRHPDAAGVEQLRLIRALTRELDMGVAEHDPPGVDAVEQVR